MLQLTNSDRVLSIFFSHTFITKNAFTELNIYTKVLPANPSTI